MMRRTLGFGQRCRRSARAALFPPAAPPPLWRRAAAASSMAQASAEEQNDGSNVSAAGRHCLATVEVTGSTGESSWSCRARPAPARTAWPRLRCRRAVELAGPGLRATGIHKFPVYLSLMKGARPIWAGSAACWRTNVAAFARERRVPPLSPIARILIVEVLGPFVSSGTRTGVDFSPDSRRSAR